MISIEQALGLQHGYFEADVDDFIEAQERISMEGINSLIDLDQLDSFGGGALIFPILTPRKNTDSRFN